jgi:hypothetical protein
MVRAKPFVILVDGWGRGGLNAEIAGIADIAVIGKAKPTTEMA